MTYQPVGKLAWENITTSEQLSGRTIDGAASYIKLIKRTGAAGTGDVAFAHGITGITRVVLLRVMLKDAVPQWFQAPYATQSVGGTNFGLACSINATNVTVHIGASWAATNAISELWAIVEYLK